MTDFDCDSFSLKWKCKEWLVSSRHFYLHCLIMLSLFNTEIFCTTKCHEWWTCEALKTRWNPQRRTLVSFGGRFPVLCADHRQAHLALLIDVGVINLCLKSNLRRFEGVLRGENDFDFERTFVIRRVILQEPNKVVLTVIKQSCTVQNESFVPSRTYRHNEPLPWQQVWFLNLNVSEVFHSRFANLIKFLYKGEKKNKNQSY